MTFDIYCRNEKCPICGSNFSVNIKKNVGINRKNKLSNAVRKRCKNGCYEIEGLYGWYHSGKFYVYNYIFIFDEVLRFNSNASRLTKKKIKKQIKSLTDYWKKDYHYIAEILSR